MGRWALHNGGDPFLTPKLCERVLHRRMMAVGRFSLISETGDKQSIPVFFLALSREKKKEEEEEMSKGDPAMATKTTIFLPHSTNAAFSVLDFKDAWIHWNMPVCHPRFHSFGTLETMVGSSLSLAAANSNVSKFLRIQIKDMGIGMEDRGQAFGFAHSTSHVVEANTLF